MPDTPTMIDRLTAHAMLGSIARDEIEWLAAQGVPRSFLAGEVIFRRGDPLDEMYVILSGSFVTTLELASGRTALMETTAGDVSGLYPYSRATSVIGDVRVLEDMDVLSVHRDCFPEMALRCPRLTERLVHRMIDRAKSQSSLHVQDERLKSLGRLAAGLAHELDNPASAALRGARSLRDALDESTVAHTALEAMALSATQREALAGAIVLARQSGAYDALVRVDRHEALADWLDSRGLDVAVADALVDSTLDVVSLDQLARHADGSALACMVQFLAAEHAVTSLTSGIDRAVSRIHDLVSSVRRFTNLSRAPGPAQLDLAQGLRDVVALHTAKAVQKAVEVSLELEPDLPPVNAGDEMNQAWASLLDNALDAVSHGGTVTMSASRDEDDVVVRVVDNGPGIPPDVEARMFEPFFTTKPQGEGMGLGLDLVRRVVLASSGKVTASSRPGHTEFRVLLPVAHPTSDVNAVS